MAAENEKRAKNVGILAMDIYVPPNYVKLARLEDYDRVWNGKYTTVLGQESFSFCSEVEDVISMSLTVVSSLLKKYSINPKQIGWMEVGNDTVIDRSKSIKSFLMQLFEDCDNTDIECVDSTNGSYGVTAALFNCVNWVESSSWDGRYGLVICSDSVLYAEERARPIGGAAAIAMLIGPDAPIVFESKLRASYMSHAYDFYKPNIANDQPVVDANCYHICRLTALDSCYERFCSKYENLWGKQFSIDDAAYFVLYSLYNMELQKSFARLVFKDVVRNASSVDEGGKQKLECFTKLSAGESYLSKDLQKASLEVAMPLYDAKVQPSTLLPKKVGNMGNGSVYAAFISLLHNKHSELNGKRVVMFSYGNGITATMFSIRLFDGEHQFSLSNIAAMIDVDGKLKARREVGPVKFAEMLKKKIYEQFHGAKNFETDKKYCSLLPTDAFYLSKVDHMWRRIYLKNSERVLV